MPERTCVICREKKDKKELFRLAKIAESNYKFDKKQAIQSRAIYLCKSQECIKRVAKNKKLNISTEELLTMLNLLKKESKDYLRILAAMRASEHLTFGMNLVIENIEHIHLMIIAEDISDKNDRRLLALAKSHGIPYIHYGEKVQLGDIFNKNEINVIAITNKKVAKGMLE